MFLSKLTSCGHSLVIFLCLAFTLIQHLIHHFGSVINSRIPNKKCNINDSNMKDVLDLTKALRLYEFRGLRKDRMVRKRKLSCETRFSLFFLK